MSPASKSKSKDKKAGKEPQKASSKSSGSANTGIPTSAYNPLLGTFHTLETASASSALNTHNNGRFRNIDETDEHSSSSFGAGVEYDSVSNNGSWSGDSEDHKDKTSNLPVRQETIPGAVENDKQEKIRYKNERKHQRQKERRAQELHERCSSYLMSRKLEALSQQFVAMGFSQERATMALIMNEGRVEESVAWLFEGGEEADKHKDQYFGGGTPKIDISEELARIADMEISYKCSKQEVERAVVSCEGNLEKAAETLRLLKRDTPPPPKTEETGDPSTVGNGEISVAVSQNSAKLQSKSIMSSSIQQRRNEKDFNYTKTTVTVGVSLESGSKNMQPLKRTQPKVDWAKPQHTAIPAEKRWSSAGSNPSVSYSLTSPLQMLPSPAKTETQYAAVGSELKNPQPGTVREPVVMMQRPQSVNTKQVPATSISSSLPGTAASWYPTNSTDIMKPNGMLPQISSPISLSPNNLSSNQMYLQLQYQQQQQQHLVPSSGLGDSTGTSRGNGSWGRIGASPTLAAASSLGLFPGLGSTGSSGASSPVDWNNGGSMMHSDYTCIDWSLDPGLTSPKPTTGLWLGLTSFMQNNGHILDSNPSSGVGANPAMKSAPQSGDGVSIAGLQDGGSATAETSAAGSHEWTSPFGGQDLFSLPRRFVSSPR